MNFEENIKEWVQIDNQLKKINETTKTLRTKKSELAQTLFTI
jgi:hypothetical protein